MGITISLETFLESNGLHSKNILYSVLDWGLGHATRSIPIVEDLLAKDNHVILAGNGKSIKILEKRFPDLPIEIIDGHQILYAGNSFFLGLKVASQVPSVLRQVKNEHTKIEALVLKHQIDALFSDHRYGCYSNEAPSYFITHQLSIKVPFGHLLVQQLHRRLMSKFSEIIVLDVEGDLSLAGNLSRRIKLNQKINYIGTFSRFRGKELNSEIEKNYKAVAIVSGPEPSRSIFEHRLMEQFGKDAAHHFAIVRGNPSGIKSQSSKGNITFYDHLDDDSLLKLMAQSQKIISRSGYSSLMDYQALGIQAELYPTPGQSEQEYLAKLWSGKALPKPTS